MFFYDEKHKVTYFGEWAEDGVFHRFRQKALDICAAAVVRCHDEDVRGDADLATALDYIGGEICRPILAQRFRKALDTEDAKQRFTAARAAYETLARSMGG